MRINNPYNITYPKDTSNVGVKILKILYYPKLYLFVITLCENGKSNAMQFHLLTNCWYYSNDSKKS